MLTLNDLIELEDNYQPVASVKVKKFREHKVRKNSQPNYNSYRTISNDLLD